MPVDAKPGLALRFGRSQDLAGKLGWQYLGKAGRSGRTRTCNPRFWSSINPVLRHSSPYYFGCKFNDQSVLT
jgi:hypothetical protein